MVSIAAKMYGARKSAISLYGKDGFKSKVAEYRPIIEAAMRKHKCDELHAMMEVSKVLIDGHHGGIPVMLTLATVVEMLEPSQGI